MKRVKAMSNEPCCLCGTGQVCFRVTSSSGAVVYRCAHCIDLMRQRGLKVNDLNPFPIDGTFCWLWCPECKSNGSRQMFFVGTLDMFLHRKAWHEGV